MWRWGRPWTFSAPVVTATKIEHCLIFTFWLLIDIDWLWLTLIDWHWLTLIDINWPLIDIFCSSGNCDGNWPLIDIRFTVSFIDICKSHTRAHIIYILNKINQFQDNFHSWSGDMDILGSRSSLAFANPTWSIKGCVKNLSLCIFLKSFSFLNILAWNFIFEDIVQNFINQSQLNAKKYRFY